LVLVSIAFSGCSESRSDAPAGTSTDSGAGEFIGDASDNDDGDDDGFCENLPLEFGTAGLPPALVGGFYSVNLRDYAEPGWSGAGYSLGWDAPPWLEIPDESSPVIEGTPEEEGYTVFTVSAYFGIDEDGCSTVPDEHTFTLSVVPMGETTSTSGDSGSSEESESSGESSSSGTTSS
jgi:hypothetical protein